MQPNKRRNNGMGCAYHRNDTSRNNPWDARINIGKDIKGNKIYYTIDSFENELDALVCLQNYHKNPQPLYIKEDIYNRIVTFPRKPYPLVPVENPNKKIEIQMKKDTYTFKQVFEKFEEAKLLTKEEAQLEKTYHIRPKNKPFGRHYCRSMTRAYHLSEKLYDRVYRDLRASDFNKQIKECGHSIGIQEQMANLYKNLDKFALEEDIIEKGYAQFIATVSCNRKEIKQSRSKQTPKEKLFSYEQIDYLWNLKLRSSGLQLALKQQREQFIRDFWLMLLYTGCRADELLSVFNANIFLDENYFIGGLKTQAGINREIPIHPKIKHLFEKYYNTKNEFLFMQPNGNKIDYSYYLYHFQNNFQTLHSEVGEHTAHDARHTLRTELKRLNVKDVVINSIVGHSNEDIGNDVYTHITIEEKIEAIKLITYKERNNLYILTNETPKKQEQI